MRKKMFLILTGLLLGAACIGVNTAGAKAASVYIVTKEVNGRFYTPTTTYYKYTKSKQLKKSVTYSSGEKQWRNRWFYNKKKQLIKTDFSPLNGSGHGDVIKCTRNKKGRAGKVEKVANTFYRFKFNKKGRPVSYVQRDVGYDQQILEKGTIKYNKKGLVKSISTSYRTTKYSYDKHGNMKTKKDGNSLSTITKRSLNLISSCIDIKVTARIIA